MITHIVLFKLKEADPQIAAEMRRRLLELPARIPEIRHFEVGLNVVESPRAYDVALYSRFDSLETLQIYQDHPAHREVVAYIQSVTSSIVAADYES